MRFVFLKDSPTKNGPHFFTNHNYETKKYFCFLFVSVYTGDCDFPLILEKNHYGMFYTIPISSLTEYL